LPSAPRRFVITVLLSAVLLSGASFRGAAQNPSGQTPPGQTAPVNPANQTQLAMLDALNAMQPMLMQINLAVSSVDVRRWKAPNDVRDTTTEDVQSIQRDLSGTLPVLLTTAQSSPNAVGPAFAVFRNIDALYDVLLRITETATLAGTTSEADRLEQVRAGLQARRGQLGNAILASAAAQDNDVMQLRTALQSVPRTGAQPGGAPKKIVVNDGPDTAPAKTTHKKKPAPAASTTSGATTTPQQ
jgi:hypothetical protein